jgi:TonB family protein
VSVVNITIPAYPLLPLGGREEGIVSAAISVNSSGKVEHVVTSGASESLRRAAEDAARRWEFKPHGRSATINFVFVLKDKKADVCKSSVNFLTSIRVEICEERKKIVTISDPPMVDLTKSKKQ